MTTRQRHLVFWSLVLVAWWLQVCPGSWAWPEAWRPEFLLIILTYVALRASPRRAAWLGLLLGWLTLCFVPRHPWILLGFWILTGYGLGWLRTQWHTEGVGLLLVVAWIVVMAWHLLTWCVAWRQTGVAPALWNPSFLFAQACVTLAGTAVVWRYAGRWLQEADAA